MIDLINKMMDNNIFSKTIDLSRNQLLKRENTIDQNVYYITSGSLKIFMNDEEEERIIRFGYQQNLIVCLDSFISDKKSNLIIQSIKKTTLKVATKNDFLSFIQQDIAYINVWINILQDLILQQLEREKDLLTYAPKQRYLNVLQRSPQLFQEIPNKYIANYLRMTPETLSRLKKS